MTFNMLGRAAGLALSLMLCSVSTCLAHALPGSTLILSNEAGQLRLSVSLPLEDLILAAPGLEALEAALTDQNLSAGHLATLAGYFTNHLIIQQSTADLTLTLQYAPIQAAYNDHVGDYDLLVIQLGADLSSPDRVFPLTLVYDAVMHEVRNHRATVIWMEVDAEPRSIAEFGFRPIDGNPQPILLLLR